MSRRNPKNDIAGPIRRWPVWVIVAAALVLLAIVYYQSQRPPVATRADWYELHFTTPEPGLRAPPPEGGIEKHLTALMNRATRTLDVAAYDFDLLEVAAAMAAAQDRGVRVRMVTDSDTVAKTRDGPQGKKHPATAAAFEKLWAAGVPVVEDNRSGLMHNKFVVVDGEWVQTGSWNYSFNCTYKNNNHQIIVRSKDLAENYTREFEKMFVEQKFGKKKEQGVPHPRLTIGGVRVENYFAAEDDVAERIIEEIGRAQESVYFMAYQFTHDGIGQAVRDRHKAGVRVGGVFERLGSGTEHSEYGRMKKEGLEVYTDGNPDTMHHKVFIIDERTVICGSFNFTSSASDTNDENILIIEAPAVARAFKEEYDRVLAWAKDPARKK